MITFEAISIRLSAANVKTTKAKYAVDLDRKRTQSLGQLKLHRETE
jgi:hypothetical protein